MAEFRSSASRTSSSRQGGDIMHAVLTVTCDRRPVARTATGTLSEERSELIIVDTSGSMRGEKLRAAKAATAAAIDCIPDGVRFGVVAGNHEAIAGLPVQPPLAVASAATRERGQEGRAAPRGRRRNGHRDRGSALAADDPGRRARASATPSC